MQRPFRSRRLSGLAIVLAATLVTACGSTDDGAASASAPAGGGRITVFAAASLTEAFTELGRSFEAARPGTTVAFSFGPSSGLAAQIVAGAPADVFAAASPATMERAVTAKAARPAVTFARNVMEIAVPPGNPAGVRTVADLARPGVKVALCAPDVPCGVTARGMLRNAGVAVRPVTEEVDVKAALTKVRLGEVDAAVVYVTDVLAAGDEVQGVAVPADLNESTSYPISTLTASSKPALAQAFVDHVRSPAGLRTLAAAGFRAP